MTLEEHSIKNAFEEYSRKIWFLPSATEQAHRLCIFLDGEFYLRDLDCIPILRGLLETAAVPPTTCLFVSHLNGEARHRELTCDEGFTRFIADDVVSWAGRNARINPLDNAICGLSLSGLASAYTTFRYPLVFSRALSQSGSFWWLADHDVSFPPAKPRLWMSVGKEETLTGVAHPPTGLFQRVSQLEGVENAVRRFESLGATVKYNPHDGGHAMAAWRNELPPALQWLLQP